jgi:two-component system alkaline phosphatase synthesis response regulator PhoP
MLINAKIFLLKSSEYPILRTDNPFLIGQFMKKSILIVDDEQDIRQILSYNLQKEGFETYEAENGEEGIRLAEKIHPDIIILDVMMPGMDGIEVCETIRKTAGNSQVLICFLTARGEDYSQIAGLDAGADDYISKPIKPKVLISRINALIRRRAPQAINSNLLPDLIINREKYIVMKGLEEIKLPRKEFELLALLTSQPDVVFQRNEILNTVWGTEIVVGDRTIDVHVRKIREKIGEDYITTVKGVGYKYSLKNKKI